MLKYQIYGQKVEMVVARSWDEERIGNCCPVGLEFQFCKTEGSSGMDGAGGNAHRDCTLNMG